MPLWTGLPDNSRHRNKPTGSRIVKGLGDLGDLDAAPPSKKVTRTETSSKVTTTAGTSDEDTKIQRAPALPTEASSSASSVAPSAGIFGTWDEWRSASKYLFPLTKPNPVPNSKATLVAQQIAILKAELQRCVILDEKVLEGLAIIDSWRIRSRPAMDRNTSLRVPRYAEATAILAEAQLLDRAMQRAILSDRLRDLLQEQQQASNNISNDDTNLDNGAANTTSGNVVQGSDRSSIRPSMVTNSYGGAISRALHVLTGGLIRTNSFDDEETSYRSRAQEVGLPEEAVEVRRRVAHGNMPLLSELRLTAALLMEHLHERYWALQESQIKKLLRIDEREEKNLRRKREREGVSLDNDDEVQEDNAINSSAPTTSTGTINKVQNAAKNQQKNRGKKIVGSKRAGKMNNNNVATSSEQKPSVSAADVMALLSALSDDDDDGEKDNNNNE